VTARTPDLDAEQDLDLGGLWSALVARWWLPVVGAILGAILGYVVSFGGTGVYSAQALVYLGQPLSPGGAGQLASLGTNPSTVRQIVASESVIRAVAARSGVSASQLRSNTSANPAPGSFTSRTGFSPLVTIKVRGGNPRRTAIAANAFARQVVGDVSGYVTGKIVGLRARLAHDQTEAEVLQQRLVLLNKALAGKNLTTTDGLIISGQLTAAEQQLGSVQQDQLAARQLLSLAQNVEASRIVTPAVAVKATARSRRNYILVGLLIGLIVGAVAAILWEPAARAARRPSA
jgi:uncharacterized protein involved in exopolysaccharide biosynthesis